MIVTKIETNIKRNLFLHKTENLQFSTITEVLKNNIISLDISKTFQSFLGFGGAFTESTGYALSTISDYNYNKIMDEYFSKNGLNYSFGRLPIGSCDFSLKSYSYSYKDDLSDFSIEKDLKYIVPSIKAAQQRNQYIKFIASPWSPPAFMKNNKKLKKGGKLLDRYKDVWSNYLIKYVEAYNSLGINIDYMTIQNEPDASQSWESCTYTAEEEADLLNNHLFPLFDKYGLNTKFLIWDHNKDCIYERVIDSFVKYGTLNTSCGVAFHWYAGSFFDKINELNKLFPDKLLIHTEGCTGYSKFKPKDELFNAEMYGNEIIGDLNSGTNAFIDWNLVLEYNGGPNHKRNYCNSPIMINKKHTDYIKTPAFYYIAHFSKYINPNSKRISLDISSKNILGTSFINPDNSIVVVLLNKNDFNIEFNLKYKNSFFHDNLDSHAIVTFIIRN